MTENRQLKEQIKQLKEYCEKNDLNQLKDIENTENYIHTSIKQLNDQFDIDENRIEKHEIEIEYLKNQIVQMDIEIKKLQEENYLKQIDTIKINQQCSQHELQIKQLIKKLNLIVGTYVITLNHRNRVFCISIFDFRINWLSQCYTYRSY
jgi:chromosome segregation ATPase